MKKIAIAFLFFSTLTASLFAQGFKSNLQLADDAFAAKNYFMAAEYYNKVFDELKSTDKVAYPYKAASALKKNEEFSVYKYVIGRLGESYYNYHDYKQAEVWYAKSTALDEFKDLEQLLNYATTLRANAIYDEAVVMFNKAKRLHIPQFTTKEDGSKSESEKSKAITRRIDFELACSEFAVKAIKNKYNIKPEKLDTIKVNNPGISNYAASLITKSKIIFTSTRFVVDNPSSKRKGDYANSFLSYDLYDSTLQKIDFGFGIDRNVASPSFTGNGLKMYFTSWSAETDKPEFQIYMSQPLNDSIWEEAKILNGIVNLPQTRNMHPYVTKDGTGLYFASDRKEGLGGLDIYYVRLDQAGQPTGRVINLGPNVNSEGDDQSPFLDEASQSLYFSSNGWIGMGGFDLFVSERKNEEWKKPTNLGYPMNSSKDDAYLVVDEKANAFFSTDRTGDCCYELYSATLNFFVAKGRLLDGCDDKPIADAKVVVTNKGGTIEYSTVYTDDNGYFIVPISKGLEYDLQFSKKGYIDNNFEFSSAQARPRDTLDLGVTRLLCLDIGKTVRLDDIYYDFDKATLRPESKMILDKLAKHLKKFPFLLVEIGSHTDSKGTDAYNFQLSQERAQSVVNYLITVGIPSDMIRARGYGESVPRIANENPDGSDNPSNRQLNRRTEFKILEIRKDKMGPYGR